MTKFTILDFQKKFPTNEVCLDYLFQKRYGNKICPKCGRKGQYHRQDAHYVCNCGGDQVSPKAGTIFEKSSTDLVKWFFAIFLFSQSRNGVAAKELERELGVTYKTAWRMAHEIRKLMQEDPLLLSGEVEADETMVGGYHKGPRGRAAKGKTVVFGIVERERKHVNTHIVKDSKAVTLYPYFRDNVARGTKLITDELKSYKAIAEVLGEELRTVSHGAGQYAKPDGTHTNTIEGFWSQLKRSLDGTHHVISPKWLSSYLGEFQFRYNYGQHDSCHLFDWLLSRVSLPHVLAAQRIDFCRWHN